jgi:hypothetical protein
MTWRPALAVAVAAALGLGACGGTSKADKAKNNVCDARADISKQIDTLKGLTISTATTSQIRSSVQAISDDLKTITESHGDRNDERKSQVQQANEQFTAQVKDLASTIGRSTSLSSARTQLTSAFQQLGTTYQQTFAKVDCS